VLGLFLLWAMSTAHASEVLVLSETQMAKLDPQGRVELRTILADGMLLLLSQRTRGEKARLLVVDPSAPHTARAIELPFPRVEHLQANRAGTAVLVYDSFGGMLWQVGLSSLSATRTLLSHKGQSGFGLYGANRSRIFPLQDEFAAWGFFVGSHGEFAGDYLVRVGRGRVEKWLRRRDLTEAARRLIPGAHVLNQVSWRKATWRAWQGRGEVCRDSWWCGRTTAPWSTARLLPASQAWRCTDNSWQQW